MNVFSRTSYLSTERKRKKNYFYKKLLIIIRVQKISEIINRQLT